MMAQFRIHLSNNFPFLPDWQDIQICMLVLAIFFQKNCIILIAEMLLSDGANQGKC
jgi:hypothetical protein